MDNWSTFIRDQYKHPRTRLFTWIGLVLILIALFVGIPDNPPGIVLTYLGTAFLFLACIHHWREAGQYGTLLAVSVVSFPVLTLLHNVFEVLQDKSGGIPVVDQLFSGFSVVFFLAAIFVSPVGVGLGIIHGLYYLIRTRSA